MADQLQLRGGTTVENEQFTGVSREVTIDTTKNTVVVHDGFTEGGHPLLREQDTAALLARANHTGTQVMATIADAGTAATQDITETSDDTTAGRLLKVGDNIERVVDAISDLIGTSEQTVKSVRVLNYHTGLEGGGGVFYWDATKVKSEHNGGTVIDPTAVFPTDWDNQTQLGTWFDTSNTGTGCWVRQYDGAVNVKWFGAKGDGVTDDTAAVKSALLSIETTLTVEFSTEKYLLDPANAISLTNKNGLTVDFKGATLLLKENLTTSSFIVVDGGVNITFKNGIIDAQNKFIYRVFYVSGVVNFYFTNLSFVNARYPSPEYVVNNLSSAATIVMSLNVNIESCTFFEWYYRNYDASIVDGLGSGGAHLGRCLDFHEGSFPCSDVNVINCRARFVRLAFNVGAADDLFFNGNYLTAVSDNGLYGSFTRARITNNHFNVPDEGIVVGGTDIIIANNTFNSSNKMIAFHQFTDNVVIESNVFKTASSPNAITDRTSLSTQQLGSILIQNNVFDQPIDYALIYLGNRSFVKVTDNLFKVTSTTGGRVIASFNDISGTKMVVENNIFDKNYTGGRIIQTAMPLHVSNNKGLTANDYSDSTNIIDYEITGNNDGLNRSKFLFTDQSSSPELLAYYNYPVVFTGYVLGSVSIGGTDNTNTEPLPYAGLRAEATSGHGNNANGTKLLFGSKPDTAIDGVVYSLQLTQNGMLQPTTDNLKDLGGASNRWRTVYAGTGVINTSDEREKTFLQIDDVEKAAALELKSNMRKFKFKDAVAEKGDNARVHYGVSAQQVATIMQSHGLDPNRYSFFCYDEWEEVVSEEDGSVLSTGGNRYGIRYDELLCFIMAAI